jgi:DNA (cytosine-5)-methyltransferase 1
MKWLKKMEKKIKHLDLFSGIGGFALAAERVWLGIEHTFCDNEPFSQAVLSKHWPNAKIYGDIRTLTNTRCKYGRTGCSEVTQGTPCQWCNTAKETERLGCPYILTGGFPCQPFSAAGARRGTEDGRHLWPEMLRVIREFNPRWIIGENVGGLVTWSEGLVLEQIHVDLESEGYEVQSFIIPAVSLNAPHRRDRIWIVAHAKDSDDRGGTRQIPQEDGEIRQVRQNKRTPKFGNANKNNPDSFSAGLEGVKQYEAKGQRGFSDRAWRSQRPDWNQHWIEVATRLCRMDDGIPKRLDRNPRLKALGNAIVPQVAEEIMRAIKKIDE